MRLIHKIDLGGQAIAGALVIVLLAADELLSLIALFILGCWQVLSALINSFYVGRSGYSKHIILYWTLSIGAIITLTASGGTDFLFTGTLVFCFGIAVYYWILVRSHYKFLAYRKELSTLIRNI